MIPASNMSTKLPVFASKPTAPDLRLDLLGDHAAVMAGVGRDVADRLLEGPQNDGHAELLVALELGVQLLDGRNHADQGHAATGDDPFFGRRPGRVQGVFDAGLGLLHVGLGRSTDANQSHAAGELGEPLLELLLVVLAVRLLDLAAKLIDPALDVGLLAGPLDDGCACPCRP